MKKIHDRLLTLLLAAALLCGGAVIHTGGWSANQLSAQWAGGECEEDEEENEEEQEADAMPGRI